MKALRTVLPALAATAVAALAYQPAVAADRERMPIRADVFACGPGSCEGGAIEREGDGIHVLQNRSGESETLRSLMAATDNLNLHVADYGYVALEADVMIRDQGARASGRNGVPAWVRMVYSDRDGQVHEVYRGFYIVGPGGRGGDENLQRIRKGKLSHYISANLMTLESRPAAIHYFEFGGDGVAFDASIAVMLSMGAEDDPASKELVSSAISWGQLKGLSVSDSPF
jgi:hypothetical protein